MPVAAPRPRQACAAGGHPSAAHPVPRRRRVASGGPRAAAARAASTARPQPCVPAVWAPAAP
eukprot:9583899-Lingulodinium_polyedra.AAC.1